MFEVWFLLVLGLIWIIFATVQDIRSKEVANWLNFSLIVFALGFRFFWSLFSSSGFDFFYQGLIGFGIFFLLGNLFYYSRIFAGGDAKLMIALGTILPLSNILAINLSYFVSFLLIFLITGTFYGLAGSFILIAKNFKDFKKGFSKLYKRFKKPLFTIMFFGLAFMLLGIYDLFLFLFGILIFIFPWLFVYSKAIDEHVLVTKISTKKLREGDWLYKNVRVGKKMVKANWDGLSQKEINLIKKKHRVVEIRQGIVFVPVFLISYIVFILWNSLW